MNNNITAVILAAGNSIRYGKNVNKNFELINGKAVISYSIKVFTSNESIDNIIIVSKKNDIEKVENIIKKEKINKPINIVLGGDTRQESVYNAIKSTNSKIVIIHDAARPVIKNEYIDKCIESIKKFKGVTIGVKSKDTIKIANNNGIVINTTERNNTWVIQTPQCFDRKILLESYKKFGNIDVTDECTLLEKNNYKIKIIEGNYTNIKITTIEDIIIASEYLMDKIKKKGSGSNM